MEHQLATKSTQKELSEKPAFSSPLHQSSSNQAMAHPLLRLQRAVGNQAVQNLLSSGDIQTRLPVGQPGDRKGRGQSPPSDTLSQNQSPLQKAPHQKENSTGLPDILKAGIEHLSGLSMDDVHVHYNSSKPAEVQALAYTEGTEIHVGPGQEKHLPHEAWHVIQQKQGRVSPTMQLHGIGVNDDSILEREADTMGMRVSQAGVGNLQRNRVSDASSNVKKVIQRNNVVVGFDRIDSGRKNDFLVTSGLANCIAVVAYDRANKTAFMAHYNTSQGTEEAPLQKLKSMLTVKLGGSFLSKLFYKVHPEFFIGLGTGWYPPKKEETQKFTEMRHKLLLALKKVFETEPTAYGNTIAFDVNIGDFKGENLEEMASREIMEGSEMTGEEIVY